MPITIGGLNQISGTLDVDIKLEVEDTSGDSYYATASQILGLGGFLTDYTVTQNDVTQHQAALTIASSQIPDFGSWQPLSTILTNTTASFTTGLEAKLNGIESGATADQTGPEIVSAIDTELGGSSWQSGGAGASYEPSCFQALNSASKTSTTSFTDVTNLAESINQGDYSLNGTTGEITFTSAGTYSISFHALGDQSGNNRSELGVRATVDTGTGYTVPGGATDKQYNSRNGTQDEGSAQINNFLLRADANDKIKFQLLHVGVAQVFGANDIRVSIMKMNNTGRT